MMNHWETEKYGLKPDKLIKQIKWGTMTGTHLVYTHILRKYGRPPPLLAKMLLPKENGSDQLEVNTDREHTDWTAKWKTEDWRTKLLGNEER